LLTNNIIDQFVIEVNKVSKT